MKMRDIHPRFYLTIKEHGRYQVIPKRSDDGHVWLQFDRLVFTTQPRGSEGMWDKVWAKIDNFRK